jgi:hypothetical protein
MDHLMTKKTTIEERTELAWAQFCTHAWPGIHAYNGEAMFVASESRRLFVDDVAGVRCVVVEDGAGKVTARIPFTNVASCDVK